MSDKTGGKDHRPYTIPYTGSLAIEQEDGTFVAASSAVPAAASHPPAPQDKAHSPYSANQSVAVRPESPDRPQPARKPSFVDNDANVSTSKNDGKRHSSVIYATPTTPFHDEIPSRFRSASTAGTAIITQEDRARMLTEQEHRDKETQGKNNTGRNTDWCTDSEAGKEVDEVCKVPCEKTGKASSHVRRGPYMTACKNTGKPDANMADASETTEGERTE